MELSLRVEKYRGKPWPAGDVWVFDGRGGSIGRSAENFMVLADPSRQISGRHGFILLREEDFFIVDTGQNGIYLNGDSEPLGWCRTAKLTHGDTIAIGDYLLNASISGLEERASEVQQKKLVMPDFATLARNRTRTPEPAPTHVTPPQEPEVESTPEPELKPAPEPPSADVLVVDDDEDISYLVKFMLERANYTVKLAMDGLAAKQFFDTAAPTRLVVLDIMLPHLDGFQLINEIRNNARWREVPVIMLSGMTAERDIVRALNAGANDYVEKPFKPAELVARLKRFLA